LKTIAEKYSQIFIYFPLLAMKKMGRSPQLHPTGCATWMHHHPICTEEQIVTRPAATERQGEAVSLR